MRAEKEASKIATLSRIFLYKAAECVYEMRCPQNLPDLEQDQPLFSLSIRKSASLRSLLNSKSFYGWFKIDVILTNPDIVIERWHMINLPPKPELVPDAKSQGELRTIIYRQMSQILRSVYSMLNTLPAKTLQLQLSQLPTNTRQITAVCDQFKSLPAKNESMGEFETAQIRFGPISTPAGRTVIFCNHRIELDNELPCPIRTGQHYDFSESQREAPTMEQHEYSEESIQQSRGQTFGMSYDPTGSMLNAMFSKTPNSFSSFTSEDFIPHGSNENEEQKDVEEVSLPDLQVLVETNIERGFHDKTTLDEIRNRFYELKAETEDL